MTQKEYIAIDGIKNLREQRCTLLQKTSDAYKAAYIRNHQPPEYLEFEDPEYFEAFAIPTTHDSGELSGRNRMGLSTRGAKLTLIPIHPYWGSGLSSVFTPHSSLAATSSLDHGARVQTTQGGRALSRR